MHVRKDPPPAIPAVRPGCCLALAFRLLGLLIFSLLPLGKSSAQSPDGRVMDALQEATVYIETFMVLRASDWNALPEAVRQKVGRRPQGAASGSGFLVSPEGHIITNAHVVSESVTRVPVGPQGSDQVLELHFLPTNMKVVVRSGQSGERTYLPKLLKVDRGADLAFLKIDAEEPFVPLAIDPKAIEEGEQVLMAGFPGGKLPDQAPFVQSPSDFRENKFPRVSINAGMVTAVRKTGKDFRYQLDVRANHGNSGGPIVNTNGQVVGILYAGIDAMQSINYAIPTRYLALVLPLEMRRHWPVRREADEGDIGPQDYENFKESGQFKIK